MRKSNGPLYMVTWRCTRACNHNCSYCSFASSPNVSGAISTEGGMRIVDEIYDFGASWFGISGGEPLLREDLFDIIGHAREIGLNVSLITNGHFVKDELFDNLIRNEVHTAISVDGTEETNDILRGKASYARAVSAMEKLSKERMLDCFVTTLTTVNYKDVGHVAELAEKYGARMAVFHNYIPVGRAKEHLELAPSPEQYEWVWNELYDLKQKYKGKPDINVYCPFFARVAKERRMPDFDDWFENVFLGRCFFAGRYMGIIENGDVRRCGFNEGYTLGNIRERTLKEFWSELQESKFSIKLRDRDNLKGKCGVCEYREICGGCRTRAEIYTGDIFESDPACAYTPKILRET
ncbi:MAG: radical SAM protein [Candidatus Hermodarchaeota archaeon]